MHTHSLDAWRHEHVFLGEHHERNERRTWLVVGRLRQRPEPVVVRQRGSLALAENAQTAQSAGVPSLARVCQPHRPLLPANQDTAPATLSPLRRQNPREEPGALAAPAGICAGGGEQSSVLPRPSIRWAPAPTTLFPAIVSPNRASLQDATVQRRTLSTTGGIERSVRVVFAAPRPEAFLALCLPRTRGHA